MVSMRIKAMIAGASFLMAGCSPEYTEDRGFEVRMVVDTPSGQSEGSSVVHRWTWMEKSPIFGRRGNGRFVGEAVPVDLGDRRTIYLTLTSRRGSGGTTFGQSVPWNGHAAQKLKPEYRGWVQVPRGDWPDVATFRDESRPSSIRQVDVFDPDSLGKGYRVRSVMVRNSDAEPTRQIEKRLPWMKYLVGNMDGSRNTKSNDYPASINNQAFIRNF